MIQASHTAGSRDEVMILKRTQGVRRRRSISYLAMPDAHFRRLLDYSIAESVRTYAGLISNTLENCDALSAGPATITATSPIDIRLPGVPIRHIAYVHHCSSRLRAVSIIGSNAAKNSAALS
jgi:hypothetical protein